MSEAPSNRQVFADIDRNPQAPDPKPIVDLMILSDFQAGKAVGAVVGVISASGGEVFGYGRVSMTDNRIPDGDTLFEIGSITKVFTATLLAGAVAQGTIELDDPVQSAFPETVRVPRSGTHEITFRDLATHTSGLPRLPGNLMPLWKMIFSNQVRSPYARYGADNLYAFLNDHSLQREPGAELEYSNLGFGLLGHALEVRVGKDYEDLVVGRICEPLGMNDTKIMLDAEEISRLAIGYEKVFRASSLVQTFPADNWEFDVLAGCGALRSTANDMLRFLAAQLGLTDFDISPVLESTLEPMFDEGRGSRMGLGWILQDQEDLGEPMVWHNGGTGGYRSFLGFLKKRRVGVIVLANTTRDVDAAGIGILTEFARLSQ